VLVVVGSLLPISHHVYFSTWMQNHRSGKLTKEIKLPSKWYELITDNKGKKNDFNKGDK